jgi:hypothetical protein
MRAFPGLQGELDQGVGQLDGKFTVTNSRNGFSKTYISR